MRLSSLVPRVARRSGRAAAAPDTSARAFFCFVVAYFLSEALVLAAIRNGVTDDSNEQLINSQWLAWGYGRSQPTLYTWLLFAFQKLFGVTVLADTALHFGLLALAFALVFVVLRRLEMGKGAAALGALTLFLVPQVSWEAQRTYTHSTLLLATTALALWQWLRTASSRTTLDYALLGGALGLALLSKYNAALLILALALADLILHGRRGLVADRRIALTLLIVAVLFGPHMVFMLQHRSDLLALQQKFRIGAYGPVAARLHGMVSFAFSFLALSTPPALACVVAARRWPAWPGTSDPVAVPTLAAAIFAAASLLLVLVTGSSNVSVHWPLPYMILALPLFARLLESARPAARKILAALCCGLAVLAALILARHSWTDPVAERDYARLLRDLRGAAVFDSLLILDSDAFANLRIADPSLTIAHPSMIGWQDLLARRPLAVWTGSGENDLSLIAARAGLTLCSARSGTAEFYSSRSGGKLTVGFAPIRPAGGCSADDLSPPAQ